MLVNRKAEALLGYDEGDLLGLAVDGLEDFAFGKGEKANITALAT